MRNLAFQGGGRAICTAVPGLLSGWMTTQPSMNSSEMDLLVWAGPTWKRGLCTEHWDSDKAVAGGVRGRGSPAFMMGVAHSHRCHLRLCLGQQCPRQELGARGPVYLFIFLNMGLDDFVS